MESGEIIAFFDIPGLAKPKRDGLPPWVRHLALSVDSPETLAAWKARLESHGVEVTGPVDHDGVWSSIYFTDPNAVTLELTYQARALNEADARRAEEMVAQWTAGRRRLVIGRSPHRDISESRVHRATPWASKIPSKRTELR